MDPFFLLRTIGPTLAISSGIVAVMVLAPMLLYVIARWRAHREASLDGHLGLKVALHYFAISAFQLGLAGAALLLYMVIGPGSDKGAGYRAAFGLLLPAAIVLALHVVMLRRTNDEQQPGVRRLFLGYNLIVTGLVAFFALVVGFQAMLAKGSSHGMGHLAGAMFLVYGGAWVAIGWKFGQLVLGGGGFGTASGGGHPVEVVMPPGTTMSAPQAGLPALGGGSYPPLEPK